MTITQIGTNYFEVESRKLDGETYNVDLDYKESPKDKPRMTYGVPS